LHRVTSEFLGYTLVGFVAQLVDGAIGMAYGVISTAALLTAGLSPLTASANIHFAELVTGSVTGVFHVRSGQVSWPLVRRLAIPGSLGALLGAVVLITVTPVRVEDVRRAVSLYLLFVGLWLCWRGVRRNKAPQPQQYVCGVRTLGLLGGLFDSAGGGWGPIVTANLMIGGIAPRVAIGSSVVAECIVTAVHVATFAGFGGLRPEISMAGLLVGGVLAAPLAPHLINRLPARVIVTTVGVAVGVVSVFLILR
jgi:uncharacterized membrane protein YfcA